MDREQMYHLYKEILSKNRAIPPTEQEYCEVMKQLLDVYFYRRKSEND